MVDEAGTTGHEAELERISSNARNIRVPRLKAAIAREGLRGADKMLTDEELKSALNGIVNRQTVEFEKERKHFYHNSEHLTEVVGRTDSLLSKLSGIEAGQRQLILIAAAFHDFGHAGKTHREAEDGLTNEEFSALHADAFAESVGLSVRQRVELYALIIGTTFGNKDIKPETRSEKILAIADIGGFTKSWEGWVMESADVLMEEDDATWPKDTKEWLERRLLFIAHIQKRLDELPDVKALWQVHLDDKRTTVEALIQNPNDPRMRPVNDHVALILSTRDQA